MNIKLTYIFRLLILFSILLSSICNSQSGGDYEITKSTINSGGTMMTGGEFVVIGSLGQTLVEISSEAEWQINSGFWPFHNTLLDIIFKNGFEMVVNIFSFFVIEAGDNNA